MKTTPEQKSVLIIEPNLGGHRSIYLSKIAAYFSAQGEKVFVVTLPDQKVTPTLQKTLDENPAIVFLRHQAQDPAKTVGGLAANTKREFAYWSLFKTIHGELCQKERIDRVFLPYIDYCLYALGIKGSPFGKTPFSGICMRPSFHFKACGVLAPASKMDKIKEFLFRRALGIRSLTRIYPIDELLVEYFQKEAPTLAEKLRYFPDPAEFTGNHTRESARAELKIPESAKVVLVYGALDERKGIRKLLAAAEAMPPAERPVLLFAGRQSDAIRTFLSGEFMQSLRAEGKLIELNRFVTDEDEQMCFAASDLVWVVYEGHYTMSGVLIKALQSGLGVMATDLGLIGRYAKKFELSIFSKKIEFCKNAFVDEDFHCWKKSLTVFAEE